MSDQTIFDDTMTPDNYDLVDEADDSSFEALVGEGKKFKDQNALAKAKMQSDLFIQKLIAEKREAEERYKSSKSVEDLIKSLKTDPQTPNHGDEGRDEEKRINPEDIQRLVEETVGKRERESVAQRNLHEVTEALKQKFGANFAPALKQKAQELGLGQEFLDDLARKSPKAFLSLVGASVTVDQNDSIFTPPANRMQPPQDTGGPKKNYLYYENIRKTNPTLYRSLQREMFEQASKLKDDFYKK